MTLISFDNSEYQAGEALIREVAVQDNTLTIWFEMENGKIIREKYRLGFLKDKDRAKAVIKIFFGENEGPYEMNKIVGKTCRVELEERPWKEGQPWIGIGKVLPAESEVQDYSQQSAAVDRMAQNIASRPIKKIPKPTPHISYSEEEQGEVNQPLVQHERKEPLF